MIMNNYFKVSIKIETETDKGKIKYIRQNYLISALSPTDAEAKITKELSGHDFEVTSISLTNFIDVLI